DGFVTVEELQAHADRMAKRRPYLVEVAFYTIDINDPEIETKQELQQTYDLLRKIDTNNDGKIDDKELAAFREERRKERLDPIFKHRTTTGDGKISRDEPRGLWKDHSKELDTNGDGFLDRAEVKKALSPPIANRQPPAPPAPEKK